PGARAARRARLGPARTHPARRWPAAAAGARAGRVRAVAGGRAVQPRPGRGARRRPPDPAADRGRVGRAGRRAPARRAPRAPPPARRPAAGAPPPDLVIWAEGSMDDDPLVDPDRAEAVVRAVRAARAPLLAGATTDLGGDRYATEALLFTPDGRLADRYVKRRLVPFGEYVPFGSVLRRLVPATGQIPYNKVPGHRLEPMLLDGTRFGVLVCYETAYPEDARQLAREGAGFLVMLTNNASFGRSPLGRQHLATSQLRAVEEGRPVVHASISGISAIIGTDGRASGLTGLYEAATIRAEVAPRSG